MKDCPRNGIRREKVAEETPDVAEFVSLVSVDRVIVFLKCVLEVVGPDSIELAEAFPNQAVEVGVGAFLRATFDNHVAKLDLK